MGYFFHFSPFSSLYPAPYIEFYMCLAYLNYIFELFRALYMYIS